MFDFDSYWQSVIQQQEEEMASFIADDAVIMWACTGELFSKEEFVKANCYYPGKWDSERVFLDEIDNRYISVHRVWNEEGSSHHVTSYLEVSDDKLIKLTEFWADDGECPIWRKELLGR